MMNTEDGDAADVLKCLCFHFSDVKSFTQGI